MNRKINKIAVPMAAVAATTSIAAPLVATMTSCSSATLNNVTNYDKEYGVTKKTYERMKGQFQKAYEGEMRQQGYLGDELRQKMNEFSDTMSALDRATNSHSEKNRYTSATYSLSHFAKSQYNIDLERDRFLTKKVTWSSVDQIFQGAKNSWDIYLHNNHTPDAERIEIMNGVQDKYNAMTNSLRSAYPHDTLTAIMRAQVNLVKCFEDVNEEIGLLAAQSRLNDFMSTYNITYKSWDRKENGIDKVKIELNNTIGKAVNENLMNKIFEFTNVTTGETVAFTNDIIPGHTIKPVLTQINEDKYSNSYSLDVDFQIYKYKANDTPEQIKRKTAHLYLAPNKNKFNQEGALINEDETINDLMEDASIMPTNYSIQSSRDYAKQSVVNTYFNKTSDDGYISKFHWPTNTSKPNPWETLFVNANNGEQNGTIPVQNLTTKQLSLSGLEFDYTLKSGRVVTYSFKEVLAALSDSEIQDEDMNLAYKFVKNCDLFGHVTIVADDENHHEAKATFSVSYKNEYGEQKLDGYDIDSATNFAISEKIYADTNMDFNDAYDTLDLYKNKGIEAIKHNATMQRIAAGVVMGTQGIFTAALIGCVIANPATASLKLKAAAIMSGVQLLVAGATFGTVWGLSKKVFDFSDRMDKAKHDLENDEKVNNIFSKFENDHNEYFVLWEKDENPDAAFQTKKQRFVGLPWLSSQEHPISAQGLKKYYHGFRYSDDYKRICDIASKHRVSPEDFSAMSSDYNSTMLIGNILASILGWAIIAIVDVAQARMLKKTAAPQDKAAELVVAEQKNEHKEQQAEAVGMAETTAERIKRAEAQLTRFKEEEEDALSRFKNEFKDIDPSVISDSQIPAGVTNKQLYQQLRALVLNARSRVNRISKFIWELQKQVEPLLPK